MNSENSKEKEMEVMLEQLKEKINEINTLSHCVTESQGFYHVQRHCHKNRRLH